MKENIEKSYNLIYSQRVLLKLVELGVSREEAYKIVQENAMKAWNERRDFKAILLEDNRVKAKLSDKEAFEDIFSPDYYLKNVNKIYERFKL
jgi:adenylosuccinate lyase